MSFEYVSCNHLLTWEHERLNFLPIAMLGILRAILVTQMLYIYHAGSRRKHIIGTKNDERKQHLSSSNCAFPDCTVLSLTPVTRASPNWKSRT